MDFKTTLVWNKKVPDTEFEKFQQFIETKYSLKFENGLDFHQWTADNFITFWEEAWHYVGIIASKPYEKVFVKTGDGFLDYEFFVGARLNYAENILRHRHDAVAIISDENGSKETVTYGEVYRSVQLYAAALRKNGLTVGDRVGCLMYNTKEAIYAMLATTSIGAIWGATLPYYGAKAIVETLTIMEPKFVFYSCYDKSAENSVIHLTTFVQNAPSLVNLILVSTQETKQTPLSTVPKTVFLDEFLQSGKSPEGVTPELVFEQLPFNHPIEMKFTSGTTSGVPKGVVHAAGSVLAGLVTHLLYNNLKKNDVYLNYAPSGRVVWLRSLYSMPLECRLVLLVNYKVDETFYRLWDAIAKNKITHVFIVPDMIDALKAGKIKLDASNDFSSLKGLYVGASHVYARHFQTIWKEIGTSFCVANAYGTSETNSATGVDLNMPMYAEEAQMPLLGQSIRCCDEKGKFIIGEKGEGVLTVPSPGFPLCLWNDHNNQKLKDLYLSKYPGCWHLGDQMIINPKTKGIVVVGRSDTELKQFSERFGPGTIYFAIQDMEQLDDYICVGHHSKNKPSQVVLFVKMKRGFNFSEDFKKIIQSKITETLSDKYLPKVILEAKDIPYNYNGKRMEVIVREIVNTNTIPKFENLKNPECLKDFLDIPELRELADA